MNEQEEKDLRFDPEDPDPDRLEEQDLLGFMDIAEKEIIPDIESFKPPLIYGIYGRWGTGKTFMMRALEKCFNKEERKGKYKTVWFDPWWYDHAEKEQLFLGLLRKIEKETNATEKVFTAIGLRIGAGVRTSFQLLLDSGLSKLGTSFKNAKEFWEESMEVLGGEQINQVDAIEKTRDDLCGVINRVLKEGETLVLFIDDLDRCLPDRAILLLDQLKNFLSLSRVITVLGIDDEVFAAMLQKHYEYANDKDSASTQDKTLKDFGKRYLERIIQKSYRITGERMVNSILKSYAPYYRNIKNINPTLDIMSSLWMKLSDFNARRIHRAVKDVISISNTNSFAATVRSINKVGLWMNPKAHEVFDKLSRSPSGKGHAWKIALFRLLWVLLVFKADHDLRDFWSSVEYSADCSKTAETLWLKEKDLEGLKELLMAVYRKFQQWLG